MNINQLMKQAEEMKKQMQKLQEDLSNATFEGVSGAGVIKIEITGNFKLKSVKIDPKYANQESVALLEDLIVAAFADAKSKIDSQANNNMTGLMSGVDLPPGFKLPF